NGGIFMNCDPCECNDPPTGVPSAGYIYTNCAEGAAVQMDGDMQCSMAIPPESCAALGCPASLSCDEASPACTCSRDADCADAGAGFGDTCVDGSCRSSCEGARDCAGQAADFDGGAYVCSPA
ncbi:MAG: hypothetical protein AAF721_05005, partial [Myxococcota bacterium]